MYLEKVRKVHQKLWQWLKDQMVQDVPEGDALCEFDCRKGQCDEGEWASCERRIQKAGGELWPGSSPERRAETSQSAEPVDVPQSPEINRSR